MVHECRIRQYFVQKHWDMVASCDFLSSRFAHEYFRPAIQIYGICRYVHAHLPAMGTNILTTVLTKPDVGHIIVYNQARALGAHASLSLDGLLDIKRWLVVI